ncbi:MAG: hypothetical protein M1832_000639 [Thelocarpon impressellum]|nr:MAG: hypothetical protein M1832_000639 [Thelocarpon impressellum]
MEQVLTNCTRGFDRWYDYAKARASIIIDDFDSIHEDLLPFWSLSPAELRSRTWEVTSNPWNEISSISIRNGTAAVGPNTLPTHRWMLEGVRDMIAPFAEHLPDMDIAMNLNDECRVAVQWEHAEAMRQLGRDAGRLDEEKDGRWSSDRAQGWEEAPPEQITHSRFEDLSFSNTFHSYGAATCPPGSPARTRRVWDTRRLCASCAEPHSAGAFVRSWTAAADICHQPDLADLHGFFLSPAAFKGTHELMPVFSQSKVAGYNDIIYPSAWNYLGKAAYDPNDAFPDVQFTEKGGTLFWRGATSEGVSVDGTWKGMVRQRLIHLGSNLTAADTPTILMPHPSQPDAYTYRGVPAPELTRSLQMDVATVDRIARCGGRDCADEETQLRFAAKSEFQAHWRHKYLFDVDGAGFSGRFLPFLQSRSLPFKASLFREWSAPRLRPWLHFVPQDLRLHDVHATLAYFAGLRDVWNNEWILKPHDEEGEWIAEQGREWAGKALRKEDMEIYFFRLLLEWGRLTDDRRDEIGFQM